MQAEFSEVCCGGGARCCNRGGIQEFPSIPLLFVPHRCRLLTLSLGFVFIWHLELAGSQFLAPGRVVCRCQIFPFLHVGPVLLGKQSSVLGRCVLEDDLALLDAFLLGHLRRRWCD